MTNTSLFPIELPETCAKAKLSRHGAGRRYGEVAQASNRPFFVVRRPGCGSSVATRVDEVMREDGRTAVDPLLRHGIEGRSTISDNPLAC